MIYLRMIALISLMVRISMEGTTAGELSRILTEFYTSPLVNLLLIYDSLSTQHPVQEIIEEIQNNKKGYFDIKSVDCNTDDPEVAKSLPYCQSELRKKLPALLFSKPSLNQGSEIDPQAIQQYQGQLNEKSLFKFAVPLMQLYSVELRSERDWLQFKQKNKQVPCIIYFTDKQDKISTLYKALTANFRDTIAFAHSFSKYGLDEKLNVSKYPTFLLNAEQEITAEPNLIDMIARLKEVEGKPTQIKIQNYQVFRPEGLTPDNLQDLIYKVQQYVIVNVPSASGQNHPQWSKIKKKFGKMFKLYEGEAVKSQIGVKTTPSLVFFPKSLAKKKIQKTIFNSKTSFDDIYGEIDSIIEDFTVALTDSIEMQKHFGIHLHQQKLVALLFHTKEMQLAYKVVSNDKRLQQQIVFFRMKDPNPELRQQFALQKLPALIILRNNQDTESVGRFDKGKGKGKDKDNDKGMNLSIARYTGKFIYSELSQYLTSFANRHQKQYNTNEQKEQQSGDYSVYMKRVKNLENSKRFTQHCVKQNCYLLIVDGDSNKQDLNQKYIGIVAKQSQKLTAQNFGYVDGVCHSEIVGQLDIMPDEFPVLVYVNSKFGKFSRMIGRLESNNIKSFFSKIRSGKGAMYRAYERLELESKNCEDEHKRINQLNNQEAVLSEEEAAVLDELRREDQKKRNEFSKTNEKIRKKNKGKRPKREFKDQL